MSAIICTKCGRDWGDTSYDFCLDCGNRLRDEIDIPTLAYTPSKKPVKDTQTKKKAVKIFTPKETEEFSFIRSEFDVMLSVDAAIMEFSTERAKMSWAVQISGLELILRAYVENAIKFLPFYYLSYQQIMVTTQEGESINFHMRWHSSNQLPLFDVTAMLLRFGLASLSRGQNVEYRYTKRMHRFMYWIQYSDVEISPPSCSPLIIHPPASSTT